jgi:hypothetical protein
MSNILNKDSATDQDPNGIGNDETLDPVAPQEPTLQQAQLGIPTASREPEAGVGTGMNPP